MRKFEDSIRKSALVLPFASLRSAWLCLLFDRNGKPVERFEPAVTPDSPQVTSAIEAALDNQK